MGDLKNLQSSLAEVKAKLAEARQRAVEATAEAERYGTLVAAYEKVVEAEMRKVGKVPEPVPGPMAAAGQMLIDGVSPDVARYTFRSGRTNKTDVAFAIISAAGARGVGSDELDAGFRARGMTLHRNYLFNITSRLKQQGRIDQRDRRYYSK